MALVSLLSHRDGRVLKQTPRVHQPRQQQPMSTSFCYDAKGEKKQGIKPLLVLRWM